MENFTQYRIETSRGRGRNKVVNTRILVPLEHYRILSEVSVGSRVCVGIDNSERVVSARVTSIKTWKRKQDIEIRLRYGLYTHFSVLATPSGYKADAILRDWEGYDDLGPDN